MHDRIFLTNVLRLLDERKMTKTELHELSGVSASFLSDLTKGKGNPSLKIMASIAEALQVPLPLMLEHVESEVWTDFYHGVQEKTIPDLPSGYEYVGAILPSHKAFQVKKWDIETREQIKNIKEKR